MFLELHILQNFSPSNLNRDDTGSPKDCEFGGVRRARVSSQCLKRSIRELMRDLQLVEPEHLAIRTKRLRDALLDTDAFKKRPEDERERVADAAIKSLGLGLDEDGKTQYLLYLGQTEVERLAQASEAHWADLAAGGERKAGEGEGGKGEKRTAKEKKKAAKSEVGGSLKAALDGVLSAGGRAVDLALFGRMIADLPEHNVDAASQVAHAISTHRVGIEFDFYTAVDDLKPEDTSGADMMGTIGFNSACFYRYANVHFQQLVKNLEGDRDLARRAAEAFVRASIAAIPSGKQNSMAAQNPPSMIMVVVRDSGLWSLANAFAEPVRPGRDGDLVTQSVAQLDRYWGELVQMYGDRDLRGVWLASVGEGGLDKLKGRRVPSVEALVTRVGEALAETKERA